MLFKHCFYIFNNVSFYPSLLSFPEIRKLQVPDLPILTVRPQAHGHKMRHAISWSFILYVVFHGLIVSCRSAADKGDMIIP
jgi:hypothetical protein